MVTVCGDDTVCLVVRLSCQTDPESDTRARGGEVLFDQLTVLFKSLHGDLWTLGQSGNCLQLILCFYTNIFFCHRNAFSFFWSMLHTTAGSWTALRCEEVRVAEYARQC